MMIHRTFRTSRALRRALVFAGVLVAMGGPSRIIRIHDERDWAQRLPDAHDGFTHRRGYPTDLAWQLFCRLDLECPPTVTVEPDIADDPMMAIFDRHWRTLQIALAGVLFAIGGLGWVLWGVCLRVFVITAGHWTVTYICHQPNGLGRWNVRGAGVQAADLPLPAWLGGM